MARAALPLTQIVRAGIAPAAEVTGDTVNNHSMSNDGHAFLICRNSNGGSTAHILTIHLFGGVDGEPITSRAISVAAAATVYIGPFPTTEYGTSVLIDPAHAELKLSAYHL